MSTRRNRIALSGTIFVILLAQVLLYPGIDTLVVVFGGGEALRASMWFLAAEFAAFVAFAGLWGAASDATGRRVPFIVAGAVGGFVGYGLLGLLPTLDAATFGTALGLRILQGAATIGAFSLSITMLMDLDGGHGRNMGAAGIAIGGGTALGAPLGGQLYELGPLVPVYVAGGLLLAVAVVAAVVLEDDGTSTRREGFSAAIVRIRETPLLLVPYAFGFIDRLTAGFFALVGTLYFRQVFDLDPGATGLMLALFFAPFALLQYPFGVVSDRIGRTIPVVAGSTLYGVAVVGVGVAPSVGAAALAMVLVGIIGAMMAPATMALVTDLAPSSDRGVAMAGFNAFGSVGFLAGILVGGAVADRFGYVAAFAVAGGVEIALALIVLPVVFRVDRFETPSPRW
ncbi:MFS transporter [Haladaptatus salinisoli]|uniref:MFS transporter n=1 Tax=Haladaptatus salinisoli TaxID=2884876 RepID=UPI001D0ACD43|nr:MFS transporter [Haladaptatus salinisoli]